jgi:hypothetical protein
MSLRPLDDPLVVSSIEKVLERFKEIQQGKTQKKRNTFNPTISHSESRQSITVYYRLDKKKKEQEFRYKKNDMNKHEKKLRNLLRS